MPLNATAGGFDTSNCLCHNVGMQIAKPLIDLDVAIIPVRLEPDQPISTKQASKTCAIGTARGKRVGLIGWSGRKEIPGPEELREGLPTSHHQ